MRTFHFVWHPGFGENIQVTRSEYDRLKSRSRSKSIGYEEEISRFPSTTMKFLSIQLDESSNNTNTAAGLPSHQPISPT